MSFNENAIIFDLGGVILNLNMDLSAQALKSKIPNLDLETFSGKPQQLKIYSDYESGLISSSEFYDRFKDEYQTRISYAELKEDWNRMILDMPAKNIRFLDRLRKEGKKVFLLSNTNAIHAEAIEVAYHQAGFQGSFRAHFDRAYYSFEMGLRKPGTAIYEQVISENALDPKHTLFIDDNFYNIEGAKKAGLSVIHLAPPLTLETLGA